MRDYQVIRFLFSLNDQVNLEPTRVATFLQIGFCQYNVISDPHAMQWILKVLDSSFQNCVK